MFPPQEAMKSGNYARFLSENQKALIECADESQCSVALFNLGFIYTYPQSPYYNAPKGLLYFEALIRKYAQNPLTFQARAWTEFIRKSLASETGKTRLKGELKTKETAIKELQKQVEQSKQTDIDIDRIEKDLQKQTEMDLQKQTEKDLQQQIERSRQIDVEMERKERELLQ